MSQTYVRIDPKGLNDVLNLLRAYRSGGRKALQRSLNYGAKQGRKISVDEMSKKSALKKKDIRAATKLDFASLRTLSAKLTIKGGSVSLMQYGARQTKKGVTFRLWKDGKRERYRHAFITRPQGSPDKDVYERNIDDPNYDGRTPLRTKRGPAVPNIYDKTPGLAGKAENLAGEKMLQELSRQIDLLNRRL